MGDAGLKRRRVTGFGPVESPFPCAACGELGEPEPSWEDARRAFYLVDRPSHGTYFSKSQLAKDAPRCAACVKQQKLACADFCAPTGWRRCMGNTHRRLWCSEESFAGPGAPVCTACLETEVLRHAAEERERAKGERKARLVKFKVKDVCERFGDQLEIPLSAYEEALDKDVNEDTLVDEEDVRAASDVWDGHSIAQDIDSGFD